MPEPVVEAVEAVTEAPAPAAARGPGRLRSRPPRRRAACRGDPAAAGPRRGCHRRPGFPNGKPMLDAAGNPVSDKSRLAAALLCWFVGIFGVHRFYVGKVGTGILMLVTLGAFGIWALIDLIVILVGVVPGQVGQGPAELVTAARAGVTLLTPVRSPSAAATGLPPTRRPPRTACRGVSRPSARGSGATMAPSASSYADSRTSAALAETAGRPCGVARVLTPALRPG